MEEILNRSCLDFKVSFYYQVNVFVLGLNKPCISQTTAQSQAKECKRHTKKTCIDTNKNNGLMVGLLNYLLE